MQIYTIIFGFVVIIAGGWFYFSQYQTSTPTQTVGTDVNVMEEVEEPLRPSDSLRPPVTEENEINMSGEGLTSVPASIFNLKKKIRGISLIPFKFIVRIENFV